MGLRHQYLQFNPLYDVHIFVSGVRILPVDVFIKFFLHCIKYLHAFISCFMDFRAFCALAGP